MSSFLDMISLSLILNLFAIYAVVVAFWLILENRSPQSTLAWIFLLLIFPIIGIVIYLFAGRGRHAFSREDDLMRQALQIDETDTRIALRASQQKVIERLAVRDPAVYREKLLNLVLNNATSFLSDRNSLDVLQDASEKYPRLLADIEAAQQSIHMAYYIWEDDVFTNKLKDRLIRKVQEGCEVRILVDAQGMTVGKDYLHDMQAGGVQLYTYFNFLAPFKLHTVSYRNHRKIAIIDGIIGYLGGLNMSQEHLDGGKHFESWRDTHLRIEGQAAQVLQSIFITSWFNTTGERLPFASYTTSIPDTVVEQVPIQITTSGPDSQWRAIRQLYFLMIMAAEKHLYIQSPFFIPDESILEALRAAALAGVDVQLMFAPRGTSYSMPYWAANTYYLDVVRAGARVFLYQKGYFHPKTVNMDSMVCSVGTANMDIRSFSINYEANAVIYDQRIAQELAEDFAHDRTYCSEFTATDYEKRGVLIHLRDSICRLAAPLL